MITAEKRRTIKNQTMNNEWKTNGLRIEKVRQVEKRTAR